MSEFTKVLDPQGVKLFSMFSIDASRILGTIGKDKDGKTKVKPFHSVNGDLYTITNIARTDKTHNREAISRDDMEKLRKAEQTARVDLLIAAMEKQEKVLAAANLSEEDMEEAMEDFDLCSMIEKPVFI